jgi:S1-C subfamily serine protease
MNIIDVLIIILTGLSLARGRRIGLVRQAGSTIGFIGGLFIGSWLSSLLTPHLQTSGSQSLASLLIILAGGLIFMSVGEAIGLALKKGLLENRILDLIDQSSGAAVAVITILLGCWLAASILIIGPSSRIQQDVKGSHIVGLLDSRLPPATKILSSLNTLIDPNSFPQVFSGLEPSPDTSTSLPTLSSLNAAVQADQASVVKVEGTGCGGIVEGSGFVVQSDEIVTNAHVIAGVAEPKVLDANGLHSSRVIWFDPNMDVAVLQVKNLAGAPLKLRDTQENSGVPGAVLGYPGGGDFNVQPAAIMNRFMASGRNIYGQDITVREIYSIRSRVIPGNSGGPLVATDGSVLGIVFATSTTYNNVGYVLTGHQVARELATAEQSNTTYDTGSCSQE